MNTDEMAVRLAEVDQRSKSNTHRINEFEEKLDDLNRLVTAMEVLAVEQKHIAENIASMRSDVNTLKNQVKEIEEKPAKKWDDLVAKVIWALVAAVITFALTRIGLTP